MSKTYDSACLYPVKFCEFLMGNELSFDITYCSMKRYLEDNYNDETVNATIYLQYVRFEIVQLNIVSTWSCFLFSLCCYLCFRGNSLLLKLIHYEIPSKGSEEFITIFFDKTIKRLDLYYGIVRYHDNYCRELFENWK